MQKNSKNGDLGVAASFRLTSNNLPLRLHLQIVGYIAVGWCNYRPCLKDQTCAQCFLNYKEELSFWLKIAGFEQAFAILN